jgi:hypothetical protein
VPKNLLGRCLLVGAIMCGVAVVPALAVSAYVAYFMLVPRYSSVIDFDRYNFNLRLDLYLTDDEARDSGRYLSVIAAGTYRTQMLPGWDWSHKVRTSIYRVDDNDIAVLSALGYDYKISLKSAKFEPIGSDRGEQWQYLGAFDFIHPTGLRRRLQFFGAQLAECIPMGTDDPSQWRDKPRAAARRASCPAPDRDGAP